jgi:TusA-related sulfurtransferase
MVLSLDIIKKLENLEVGQMTEIRVEDFRTVTKEILAWMKDHHFICEVKHYRAKGEDFIRIHIAKIGTE